MTTKTKDRAQAISGVGLGLREPLAEGIFGGSAGPLAFVEIHPENFEQRGGEHAALLEQAIAALPVLTHGLTLGVGSSERPSRKRLSSLRELLSKTGSPFHSEHLSFGPIAGHHAHDLLPIPWTKAQLATCVERINELEGELERPIAIENISYYAVYEDNEMTESEFLGELLDRTHARVLFDVNNVYVNAKNHGFDAATWVDSVPADRVVQVHVAGHLDRSDGWVIDTHAEEVKVDVLGLLRRFLFRSGEMAVLLERDERFDDLDAIWRDVGRVRAVYDDAMAAR